MTKKHDENKDIRLISKIASVNHINKTIQASKDTIIGIRSWGRIDYLVNYCGYSFVWNNNIRISSKFKDDDTNVKRKRETKKASKENTLTNKKKKR